MADNTVLNTGAGGDLIRDIDRSGVKTQVVALDVGGAGAEALLSTTSPMPVAGTGSYFVKSTVNSSAVQLAVGAVFVGAIEAIPTAVSVSLNIATDQNLMVTVSAYESSSPASFIGAQTFVVSAGTGLNRALETNGNFVQVTVANTGGAPTTILAVDVQYGNIPPVTQLGNAPIAINEVGGVAVTGAVPVSLSGVQPVLSVMDQYVLEALTVSQSNSYGDGRTLLDVLDPTGEQYVPLGVSPAGIDVPGQQPAKNSFPVTLATEQTNDFWTGAFLVQSTTSALWNILSPTGAPLDVLAYRAAYLQITAVGGVVSATVAWEGSNDLINWSALNAQYENPGANSTGNLAMTLSATGTNIFSVQIPLVHRWFRVRCTGAPSPSTSTLLASARLSLMPYSSLIVTANANYINGAGMLTAGANGVQAIGGPNNVGSVTGPLTGYPVRMGSVDQNNAVRYILTDQTGAIAKQQEPTTLAQSGAPEVLNQILAQLKVLTLYMRELSSALNAGVSIADDEAAILSDPTLLN